MTNPNTKQRLAFKAAISEYNFQKTKALLRECPSLRDCKFYFDAKDGPMTPLQYACRESWHEASFWLLKQGANPSGLTRDKKSALSFAVRDPNPKLVKALLEEGSVDMNTISKPVLVSPYSFSYSLPSGAPLHYAVVDRDGHAIVKLLLEFGADIDVKNSDGKTVLEVSREHPVEKMEEILTRHIAKLEKANKVSSSRGTP